MKKKIQQQHTDTIVAKDRYIFMCLDVKVISPLCTRSIYELSSTSFLFRSKFVYIYDFILCLKCSWNNLCSCSVLNCLLSTFYLSSKIVRANVWMCNVKRLQRLPATTSAKKEKKNQQLVHSGRPALVRCCCCRHIGHIRKWKCNCMPNMKVKWMIFCRLWFVAHSWLYQRNKSYNRN